MIKQLRVLALSAGLTAFTLATPVLADVNVVTSIKPVHSLVASVMRGVGEPYLIVRGSASPHTYSLKPSDAKALQGARIVFWMGEDLETFLKSAIVTLAADATVIEVPGMAGLTLLPFREGGPWAAHDRGDEEEHEGEGHEEHEGHEHDGGMHGQTDPHLWLDPQNAMAVVRAAAAALGAADPENAGMYDANASTLLGRLTELDRDVAATLSGVRSVPFIVFHDAYQYLEHRYGLSAVGSVTVSPDRQPGVERLHQIRERITMSGAACAFTEPQFRPAIMDTIVEGLDTRVGILDPLGTGIDDGTELYFTLMRDNARALADCLSGPD